MINFYRRIELLIGQNLVESNIFTATYSAAIVAEFFEEITEF
ncbi:hypothetical protein [Alkalinema sp. FACHB-956]|nr:hypothetical protein [Alkalinema sp. FACHB-956]